MPPHSMQRWSNGQIPAQKDLVSFKELLLANSIQVDALAQLLIEEGLISEQKFVAKLKQVKAEYQKRVSHA